MGNSQLAEVPLRWVEPSRDCAQIAALNRSAGIETCDALTDYGLLHRQTEGFWVYQPSSVMEAVQGWQRLMREGRRPRIRGSGHSMHGGSVARRGEVLLSTLQLNGLQWSLDHPEGPRVCAGAGAQVWTVDEQARQIGYRLPVVHDGGAAASVGGFISAGGFGVDSDRYGGFWNHVHSLQCIGSDGVLRTLTPEDQAFWTCFGGGGLGHLVVAADLRLLPLNTASTKASTTLLNPPTTRAAHAWQRHQQLLWFTLVAPAQDEWQLRPIIAGLHHQFRQFWIPENPYRYPIARLEHPTPERFHTCGDQDLIACGVWGVPLVPREQLVQPMIQAIEEAIAPLPHVQRYWQSELSIDQR